MNSPLVLGISIAAFLCALVVVAFAFYNIGKYKTITVKLYQVAILLLFTIFTAMGGLTLNFIQTIGAIVFSYFSVATISYILGYTDRPQPTNK